MKFNFNIKIRLPLLIFRVINFFNPQVALQLMLDCIEFRIMPKDAITLPRFRTYHT
jgi:hypothetical protein